MALDVPNLIQGMALVDRLGDSVSFYKIGLGMLTGGGLALANELKQERGKRVFLDMKLFNVSRDLRMYIAANINSIADNSHSYALAKLKVDSSYYQNNYDQ